MNKLESSVQSDKRLGLIVCGLAPLFYIYGFFLRVMPSAITRQLMSHFHITAAGLGVMLAFFYYGYGPMQIGVGLMFDRYSSRALMAGGVFICAVGTLLFAFTHNVAIASTGRFLIGFSTAFGFIGPLVLAARWLPSKYFAAYAGILQALGSIGAIAAEKPMAIITQHLGWQNVMFWGAVMGIIIAIIYWLVIKDYPKAKRVKLKAVASASVFKQLWIVISKSQTWWIGAYAMLIWTSVSVFATLWGVLFLQRAYNFTAETAAGSVSFMWIGIAIGSILCGWWSDYIKQRRLPLALSAAIGFVGACAVIYLPHLPIFLLDVLLFVFGCGIAGQILSFAVIKDNSDNKVAGTAAGFNNMLIFLGAGMIFQPLVGVFLHLLSPGVPYTRGMFILALSIIPLSFVIAFILVVFFIKETNCYPTYLDEEEHE